MPDNEPLILISESNRAIGIETKHAIHANALLHRAFSIFLVDDKGRILLQRRQITKYHSGGLWANTCCGHPHPGEMTRVAATRRLREEMGIVALLDFRFHARYCADLGSGLCENELVYVYFGRLQGQPDLNPEEASAAVCVSLERLRDRCTATPQFFAVWLRHYLLHHYPAIAAAVSDLAPNLPVRNTFATRGTRARPAPTAPRQTGARV